MNKKELRKNLLQKRKNIKNNYWNFYSFSIISKIFQKFNFINKKIGIYFPINKEVNSLFIFNFQNINLFLPKIKNNQMYFCEIKNNSKSYVYNYLQNYGYYKKIFDIIFENKIIQPKIKKNITIPDVIIIPILGFNEKCFRIGYGGGYYDRYLTGKNVLKIGIAFEFQKKEFHVEHHDIQLDYIFTEKKIYKKSCKNLLMI